MGNLKKRLKSIEEKLEKQSRNYLIERIFLPVLIAMVPSCFTLYIAFKTINIQKDSTSFQKLEILNKVISDFSADKPEKIVIAVELIKNMVNLDDTIEKQIENLADKLTKNKVTRGEKMGGEEGELMVDDVYQTLKASDSKISKRIIKSIEDKKYNVVVVSATTKDNAISFWQQLINNTKFAGSKVFESPNGYLVSIGEWSYKDALEKKSLFMKMPRFHPKYENLAILETQKDYWKQTKP
jgi:hypothetical protein